MRILACTVALAAMFFACGEARSDSDVAEVVTPVEAVAGASLGYGRAARRADWQSRWSSWRDGRQEKWSARRADRRAVRGIVACAQCAAVE
jgi:hypothetical protein